MKKSKNSQKDSSEVLRLVVPIIIIVGVLFLVFSEFIWTLVGLGLIGWTVGKVVKNLNQKRGIAI